MKFVHFQEWSTNPSCELHFLIFNDSESVELGSKFFFHPIILNRLASYLKMMYHYYQNWQHKSCIVFLKLATFKDLSCLFYQPLCCEIHLYCEIHYVAASINIIIKFLRCYFTIHYTFTEHAIKLCKINYIFTTTTLPPSGCCLDHYMRENGQRGKLYKIMKHFFLNISYQVKFYL